MAAATQTRHNGPSVFKRSNRARSDDEFLEECCPDEATPILDMTEMKVGELSLWVGCPAASSPASPTP